MKVTHEQLTASKKQADEQAAAIKNSDIAKQYDNVIDKAKEVKSINAELLGYKKNKVNILKVAIHTQKLEIELLKQLRQPKSK